MHRTPTDTVLRQPGANQRYLTRSEIDNILAEKESANRVRWYKRPVTWGIFLAFVLVGILGVLFSIGLTLHEAYEAQEAMKMAGSPPPFNGFFEWVHNLVGDEKPMAGWLWLAGRIKAPSAWMWGNQNGWLWHINAWLWG
jgi:hypothetical protein